MNSSMVNYTLHIDFSQTFKDAFLKDSNRVEVCSATKINFQKKKHLFMMNKQL